MKDIDIQFAAGAVSKLVITFVENRDLSRQWGKEKQSPQWTHQSPMPNVYSLLEDTINRVFSYPTDTRNITPYAEIRDINHRRPQSSEPLFHSFG